MKTYVGLDVQIHLFLTSVPVCGQALRSGRFTTGGKNHRYPLDRRLGGSQNGYGSRGEEKIFPLPGLEYPPFFRPARSQSLYRVCYPGFLPTLKTL
jgi:hypothetical protein